MRRLLPGLALGLVTATGLLFAWLWWQRSTLPYNEEGRYFDGLVVYDQQSVAVFGGLAIILFLIALGIASRIARKNGR